MMNIKTKTKLQFVLAGILFVSFAVTGCGESAEKTETKTDSVMEMTPQTVDTLKIIDTAKTRPTPTGQ